MFISLGEDDTYKGKWFLYAQSAGEKDEKKYKAKGSFEELHVLAIDSDRITGTDEYTAILGQSACRHDGVRLRSYLLYCGCFFL